MTHELPDRKTNPEWLSVLGVVTIYDDVLSTIPIEDISECLKKHRAQMASQEPNGFISVCKMPNGVEIKAYTYEDSAIDGLRTSVTRRS
ncbi:MAG: hypothetical protein AB1813_23940 [Verrucomicrobiota bacterium]